MIVCRSILTMVAVLFAAACTAPGAGRLPPPRSALLGSWSLISAEQVGTDGSGAPSRIVDGAEHATGLLVYTADGSVSVQIAGSPRPTFVRSADAPEPDPETSAALLGTYYAYFGRYSWDRPHQTISHLVTASLFSGEAGRTYERRLKIEGDLLTLETQPVILEGKQVFNRLVWRRVSTSR